MKTILTLIFPTIISFLLLDSTMSPAKSNNSKTPIESVKWLIGTWENHTSRGITYETWIQVNESELFGKSYAIKEKDTIVFETVKLIQKDSDLLYIPTVPNQNDGKPVVFKSTYISAYKLIVEAPDHDYPQVITYTRIASDQLVAEISGPKNGTYRYQTFSMKKNSESSSKNVELVRNVFRYFNEHDWSKMVSLYADPAEFKDPSFGFDIVRQTRGEILDKYKEMNKMAPDIKDEIVAVYPSGEKEVIVEFISSGTEPDGSKWRLPIISIFTIENNLITKDFTYYDKP